MIIIIIGTGKDVTFVADFTVKEKKSRVIIALIERQIPWRLFRRNGK